MEIIKKAIERSVNNSLTEQGIQYTPYRGIVGIFADMVCEYIHIKNITPQTVVLSGIADTLRTDLLLYCDSLKVDNEALETIITDSEKRMKLNEGR